MNSLISQLHCTHTVCLKKVKTYVKSHIAHVLHKLDILLHYIMK